MGFHSLWNVVPLPVVFNWEMESEGNDFPSLKTYIYANSILVNLWEKENRYMHPSCLQIYFYFKHTFIFPSVPTMDVNCSGWFNMLITFFICLYCSIAQETQSWTRPLWAVKGVLTQKKLLVIQVIWFCLCFVMSSNKNIVKIWSSWLGLEFE